MKSVFSLFDKVAILGLAIYNIATLLGMVRFGREMGDIGYMSILFFGSIFIAIFYYLKWKDIWKKYPEIITVLAFGLFLFIFYYSSFGRGPDYPWNGRFFFFQ